MDSYRNQGVAESDDYILSGCLVAVAATENRFRNHKLFNLLVI